LTLVQIEPLKVPDALAIRPRQFGDDRGAFLEWFRADHLGAVTGRRFDLAQANCSVSKAGTVRGVHFADVPPGQAKYVTCVAGSVLDYVIDLRVGSPSFGQWDMVRLDDVERAAVFIPEGFGHAFCAQTEGATVVYLCSTSYNPTGEHGINPLDPQLALDFPTAEPLLSPKDLAAPSLAQALAEGLLPDYEACLEFYRRG
jgi:dTDP-4-dehydrorhamnose 3,5-epimerase